MDEAGDIVIGAHISSVAGSGKGSFFSAAPYIDTTTVGHREYSNQV